MSGYPNNQGNPAASLPVWLDVPPTGPGPYPNDPSVSGGARPVYEVSGPGMHPAYANDQGLALAAVPVRVVPRPTGPGPFSNDPALDSSAKPVWVVSSATGRLPVYPNNQADARGAFPIYLTT